MPATIRNDLHAGSAPSPRPPRRRRLREIGAWAGAALLGASTSALAAIPRLPDQRLVGLPSWSAQGHFGSTLAMGRTEFRPIALVGAPMGSSAGGGVLSNFRYSETGRWEPALWHTVGSSPQSLPLDLEGGVGIAAWRQPDGSNSISFYDAAGVFAQLYDVGDSEARAVAYAVGGVSGLLAVGMPDWNLERGRVMVFQPDGSDGWTLVLDVAGQQGDRLGSALAAKQGLLVAGAPGYGVNGAVFVFVQGDPWIFFQRLDSPALAPQTGAEFGAAVDIDAEDGWLAVGSPLVDRVTSPGALVDVGAVYLYRNTFGWEYETMLRPAGAASYDHFGTSVALHGVVLVAGSPGEDGALGDEGAAYVYQRSGDAWGPQPRLRLSDPAAEEHDALGTSVAAGELGALVGSPNFDGNDVYDQGAALWYAAIVTLFADGFESGGTSAWSSTTP